MADLIAEVVPKHVTDALDASVRAIAEGDFVDAETAMNEARRMLVEYEAANPRTSARHLGSMPPATRAR